MARMHRENLIKALSEAIRSLSEWEREHRGASFESALVAGWKETLIELRNGERLEFIGE